MKRRECGDAIAPEQLKKYEALADALRELGSVMVAFSGGVDSAFLLKAAHETLGEQAVAVTVVSPLIPGRELDEAARFCRREGIRHIIHEVDALAIDGVAKNPVNRCYLCKRAIFGGILELAGKNGIRFVAEGSNVDDGRDYRPGLKAVEELKIKSPLRENGFTKADIRALSKMLGLDTWEKPSYACLASRFVYGEPITEEKLRMVDRAEQLLLDMGYRQLRVRIHGMLARIEVEQADISRIMAEPDRTRINDKLREYGFSYVSVDMAGYRTGNMNMGVPKE